MSGGTGILRNKARTAGNQVSMSNQILPQIQLEKTYNAAADHYDHPALSFWDKFGRRTVERLPLTPGMRVLDVCCGMGGSALPAACRRQILDSRPHRGPRAIASRSSAPHTNQLVTDGRLLYAATEDTFTTSGCRKTTLKNR